MVETFNTGDPRDWGGSVKLTGDIDPRNLTISSNDNTGDYVIANPDKYIPNGIGYLPYNYEVSYDPSVTDSVFKKEIKKLKKKIKELKDELEVIKSEFVFNKLNDPNHDRNKE